MEIRVLGRLEVERDGVVVDVGPYRQRALLALLLTRPGTVFSTDQLIDGLWSDDAAIDRQNSLWVYISGLRKALEPDREKRTEGTVLLTRSPGYVVDAAAVEIDAVVFERLLAEGRSLGETDPAAASVVLGEALASWRGRPFEEFMYESFVQAEIARLEGLRLEAVEARIEADLRRGLALSWSPSWRPWCENIRSENASHVISWWPSTAPDDRPTRCAPTRRFGRDSERNWGSNRPTIFDGSRIRSCAVTRPVTWLRPNCFPARVDRRSRYVGTSCANRWVSVAVGFGTVPTRPQSVARWRSK